MVKLPVFFPIPLNVTSSENWKGQWITYQQLCAIADVPARISGNALDRRICIGHASAQPEKLCAPNGDYFVPAPTSGSLDQEQALYILGFLAYAFLDYAARETVCGRGVFSTATPHGRPRTGKAKSGRERTQQWRTQRTEKMV